MTRLLRNATLFITLGLGLTATAQAPAARAPQALIRASDEGDLALMDLIARRGDDLALEALASDSPIELRLAALRACPALEAPEACLDALTHDLRSRDPDLAPTAALSLLAIRRELTADRLARREASTAALRRAAAALDEMLEQDELRPDLARVAGLTAASLRAACVDGSEEP